jgi:hypothetical protein
MHHRKLQAACLLAASAGLRGHGIAGSRLGSACAGGIGCGQAAMRLPGRCVSLCVLVSRVAASSPLHRRCPLRGVITPNPAVNRTPQKLRFCSAGYFVSLEGNHAPTRSDHRGNPDAICSMG